MPQHRTKPKQRLRNLKVNEISLVDDGDNPGADVLVWKRRSERNKPGMPGYDPSKRRADDPEGRGFFAYPTPAEQELFGKAFHLPGQASSAADCPPGWRFDADRKMCIRVVRQARHPLRKQPTVSDVSPAGESDEERRRRRRRRGPRSERTGSVPSGRQFLQQRRIRKLTETTSSDGTTPETEHSHELILPDGPISAGRFITEEAQGQTLHTHEVLLTDLEPGQEGDFQTSENDGHTHSVRVTATESVNNRGGRRFVRSRDGGAPMRLSWLEKFADTIREWSGKDPDDDLEKRLFDDVRAERMTGQITDALMSRVGDLAESVREIMFDGGMSEHDPEEDVAETLKQFCSAMDDELAGIFAGQIAKRLDQGDDEGAPSDNEIEEILKDLFTQPTGTAPGATRKEGDSGMDLTKLSKKDRAEVEAALTKAGTVEDLTTQLATASAEVAKLKKDGEGEEEDPLKSLPEDVRKVVDPLLKSAQDQASKATTENADLRKRLDKIEADNARETFSKGIGDLTGLPQKRDDLVELLWTMTDAEARGTMQKNLEAAAAAARRGNVFGSIGSDLGGDGDGSAYAKIEAAAVDIRKSNPKLTEAQARAQAMNDNPELYDAYLEEDRLPIN